MPGKRPMTEEDLRVLYDLAIYNCTHFGPYTAIVYEDPQRTREYTNIEIAREATQVAAGLRALGIESGDRVMVMMPNCPEVIISYQAIARVGAVAIPVMPLLKGPEVHYIAQNSGAKAIITSPLLLPMLRGALADVPAMRYIIATDDGATSAEDASPRVVAYSEVLAKGADYADRYLEDLDGIRPAPDDMAVILYTSGTTGNPKGVVLTHHNLVSNALTGNTVGAPRSEEVHLAILPLAHAYGMTMANMAYLTGARVVMQPRFDTHAVLSAIERHRVTAFAGVPAMFVALLYTPDADKYDTSSLQYCGSGSAPLPVEVLKGFEEKFHCQIREGYGLSEATTILAAHSGDMAQKPGSVGKPIPGVEVLIVDDNGNPVPTGEVGEVIARGPNIMKSYYNMPQETAAALRNGWLYTGDMGRFDEDGYLYIVERKKDLIIRGGFNIYPRDVEEVLATHPAVIEAAVVGVPSERMGEEVKAFVVARTPVDAEELMAYCRERLANYKTPSQIEFVDSLPRNAVGKIDKKELRKRHVH
ncbi:MAG TPA: long-chain fatty acid--CoA ligase [Ktedonobacteraceae bacterium]|jgi:long-chain acyl-CoA synthetase|nr:long-chain fatty acid--CoA ligase [Ktedonobacteraceae bacterium]